MSKENRNIELTDDPLTNIHIMIPMLNDRAREAVSYLMYGCFIGEEIAEGKNKKELQEAEGRRKLSDSRQHKTCININFCRFHSII